MSPFGLKINVAVQGSVKLSAIREPCQKSAGGKSEMNWLKSSSVRTGCQEPSVRWSWVAGTTDSSAVARSYMDCTTALTKKVADKA
jgi:hypothetical protein